MGVKTRGLQKVITTGTTKLNSIRSNIKITDQSVIVDSGGVRQPIIIANPSGITQNEPIASCATVKSINFPLARINTILANSS